MIKICVLGGHNHMQRLIDRDDIKFYELYDTDPYNISIPQWEKEYTDFVTKINPDYIICINIRLSAIKCNNWINTVKNNKRKFIMWSFDSYRHHIVKSDNSDLYFYGLDDDVKKQNDLFLPFYAQPRNIIELDKRKYNFGIISNKYGGYRDDEIIKVSHLLDFNNIVRFNIYNETISNFKFGLNLSVYYDGLPNYRTFEYAANGVYQICSSRNKDVLEKLFDYGISYYDNIEEIPNILKSIIEYNPEKIRKEVMMKHTLLHRIKKIMSYFNVNIRLILDDEYVWTYKDYLKRHNRI